MVLAIRLSKAGFGTPGGILAERADIVVTMLEYEMFSKKLDAKFLEMNREK